MRYTTGPPPHSGLMWYSYPRPPRPHYHAHPHPTPALTLSGRCTGNQRVLQLSVVRAGDDQSRPDQLRADLVDPGEPGSADLLAHEGRLRRLRRHICEQSDGGEHRCSGRHGLDLVRHQPRVSTRHKHVR